MSRKELSWDTYLFTHAEILIIIIIIKKYIYIYNLNTSKCFNHIHMTQNILEGHVGFFINKVFFEGYMWTFPFLVYIYK